MSLAPDILVTTVYYVATLSLAEVGRRVSRFLVEPAWPLLDTAVQEFIAAFELCAICYEINILFEYPFGTLLYALYLFLASAWWTLTWNGATAAPYTQVVNFVFGQTPLTTLAVVIPAQIAGGLMFYQYYTKPLWQTGYGQLHVDKIAEGICYSDIQSPVPVAAIVEGAGVFITLLTGNIVATRFGEKTTAFAEAFVGTALVVAALNVSGGYYNSVLATATQFGCFGSTPAEHFLVYWIGETVGAVLAQAVWEQSLERRLKPKSD